MRLFFWVAKVTDDHDCYSAIGKTEALCRAEMHACGFNRFEAPQRRVIEYRDGFDLFMKLTGEGGGRSYVGRPTKED